MRLSSWAPLGAGLLCASLARAAHFDVTVGKGGQLKFDPETLAASVGDTITYSFFAKNHSVTQSSFNDPCHVLETGGFFSGFTPNSSPDTAALTTFTITVNETTPIWVYCSQTTGNHCQSGMVHAINAPSSGNTFAAFKDKAAGASTSTAPPDGLPVGGDRVFHVEVGADGLTYTPNEIQDLVGTKVQFSYNPKNHTVTQSSFDEPCQPLEGGFSSGFIPTNSTPSGVTFEIQINDTKPIWFYCGQTTGNHCQSGMVGSINAWVTGGKTLAAFTALAAKAPPSTIPPFAPIGGLLAVNGTPIYSLNGNVLNLDMWSNTGLGDIPPPGSMDNYTISQAGGPPVQNYGWGDSIDDTTVDLLQLLQWLDTVLLDLLLKGLHLLDGGAWGGVYPSTIVQALRTMTAQTYVHRSTSTDPLQHFDKPLMKVCQYKSSLHSVDDFLEAAETIVLLEIALLVEIAVQAASADAWLVPCVATSLGSKSRMAGVMSMMQNRIAAAAPREASMPPEFIYSYVKNNYIQSCPSAMSAFTKALEPLRVAPSVKDPSTNRVTTIELAVSGVNLEGKFAAFMGPWGQVYYSPISRGQAAVPLELYGNAWVAVSDKDNASLKDLPSAATAGPAKFWVSAP